MPIWTKVAGTWKKVLDPEVKKNGAWTPVKVVSVKVGGVWQQVFAIEIVAFIAANTTNAVVKNLFTTDVWTNPLIKKRVVINPGVIVGSTNPAVAALRTDVGWAGTLQLDNYGEIQGAGGAPNSGAGGHAILCQAAGMIIKNIGAIRGGGGAGGVGGTGGAGAYNYTATEGPFASSSYVWSQNTNSIDPNVDFIRWAGGTVYSGNWSDTSPPTSVVVGAYTYYRGSLQNTNLATKTYAVSRTHVATASTSGGAGGNGGRGQGYGQTNAGGSSGSAGGTNAGSGGTGGTGGNSGSAGNTGNSGGSGNAGGGSAGAAGGAAGKAISGSNTLINTGVINGATS
ncbi:hypothetical protein PP940_gp228 [Rhizobium phage RL2RES]|uniref:Uncharacterized protein n=1 Tax=Rhizobium phage RL2RES TaxID=103371 RepID=A0A6B9JD69_9CAUD|nr:hypothetical protein PP940_gp228 [Rhizobium phage RL2RES]QGZ14136.1 hypothetical protein RL2RES_228 [Rhizobium phage RL2RES]